MDAVDVVDPGVQQRPDSMSDTIAKIQHLMQGPDAFASQHHAVQYLDANFKSLNDLRNVTTHLDSHRKRQRDLDREVGIYTGTAQRD